MKIIEKIIASRDDKRNNTTAPLIAFLGDSVTEGCFLNRNDHEAVYHNRIREKFDYLVSGAVVNILNAGIAGTTAQFAAERLDRDVISKNPDLCVVCFGLNDAPGKDEYLPIFEQSLTDIFLRLQQNGIEVIYMTPNMLNSEYNPDKVPEIYRDYAQVTQQIQSSGMMDKYMDTARKVAKEHNVPVCDCYAIWKKLDEYGISSTSLLINGINHPDKEMHELFANELLRVMFN